MKKRVVCYYPYIGAPLNDEVFENTHSWEYKLKKLLEKENIDIHTYDIVPISKADYVLVFDNLFYQNVAIMREIYENKKLEKSVYINYEPVTGHAKNHDAIGMEHLSHIFNKIVTFDDDIVDGKKFIKGNIANFFYDEKKYNNDFSKRKFITMVTNHTSRDLVIRFLNYHNDTNYYNRRNIKEDKHSIYLERQKAASFFLKKCPNDFDLYGNLWGKKFDKVLRGVVSRDKKLDVLSKYKFVISYDSYTNQNGYISEKIFDCFMAKTVPIYLGATNVDDYIPKDCFIHKKDFKSYNALYDYLIHMDEKTYHNYIHHIEKYLKSKEFTEHFSSDSSARVIFDALLDKGDINYHEALESIQYFENKKKKLMGKCAYYTLEKIHYDEKKISVSIKARPGSKLIITSNGLVKDLYKTVGEEKITFYLNYNVPHLYLKVYDQKSKKFLSFCSFEPDKTREYGLIPRGKTLHYYHYPDMNAIFKLFYVIFCNPKKIIRRIKKEHIDY